MQVIVVIAGPYSRPRALKNDMFALTLNDNGRARSEKNWLCQVVGAMRNEWDGLSVFFFGG